MLMLLMLITPLRQHYAADASMPCFLAAFADDITPPQAAAADDISFSFLPPDEVCRWLSSFIYAISLLPSLLFAAEPFSDYYAAAFTP